MYGVVMKITQERIVILCEDGSFRNIASANRTVLLGERIEVPAVRAVPEKPQLRYAAFKRAAASLNPLTMLKRLIANGTNPLKRGILAVTAAAVFMLVIGLAFIVKPTGVYAEPVALVAVDINPSIELYVDANGKVNNAALVNDDAKWLIGADELKGEDLYFALKVIIKKAEEQGYLNTQTEKTFVLLSVVDLAKTAFQVDTKKITLPSDKYTVELYYVDEQEHEKALESGLTVNKYVVMEQAKEMGVELNTEQLKEHSVVNALSSNGVNPKQFFKDMKESEKYKKKEEKGKSPIDNGMNSGNSKDDDKSNKANGNLGDKQVDKKDDKQTSKKSDDKNGKTQDNSKSGDKNKYDSDRNKGRDNDERDKGGDDGRNKDRNKDRGKSGD